MRVNFCHFHTVLYSRIFFEIIDGKKTNVNFKGKEFELCMVEQEHASKSLFYDEARG